MKKAYMLIVFFICSAIFSLHVGASEAENLTHQCRFETESGSAQTEPLYDNDLTTSCSAQLYFEIELPEDSGGLYIKWDYVPGQWELLADLGKGFEHIAYYGSNYYIQEFIEIPQKALRIRLQKETGLSALEFEIYSRGELPETVHIWKPTPSTAELMVVSTHQDDELLYLGGTIPYYSGELSLDTAVVYMAFDNSMRLHEACDGLWVCGHRQYPIFLMLPDKYCVTIDGARTHWDEDSVTDLLTLQLVKYRPQVVVSQEPNGEYGHGQHELTVECLMRAIDAAANQDTVTKKLGNLLDNPEAWSVPKCYLHLYPKNQITMPWDTLMLSTHGNKTALEVARDGYNQHNSQLIYSFSVDIDSAYDCRVFGLYRSTVGNDTGKNDFFENISIRPKNQESPQISMPSDSEAQTSQTDISSDTVASLQPGSDDGGYIKVIVFIISACIAVACIISFISALKKGKK